MDVSKPDSRGMLLPSTALLYSNSLPQLVNFLFDKENDSYETGSFLC